MRIDASLPRESTSKMNNRLYVGNLAFHTTEDTLLRTFGEIGEVSEAKLIIDRETGRSRGFAFVSMSSEQDAQRAIEQMDGADLDGRALRVNIAEERRPRAGGDGGGGGGGGGGFRGGRGNDRGGRGGGRGGGGGGRW
jgi:RNA recognition motif-containing protein